jgi:hypothetical protein
MKQNRSYPQAQYLAKGAKQTKKQQDYYAEEQYNAGYYEPYYYH